MAEGGSHHRDDTPLPTHVEEVSDEAECQDPGTAAKSSRRCRAKKWFWNEKSDLDFMKEVVFHLPECAEFGTKMRKWKNISETMTALHGNSQDGPKLSTSNARTHLGVLVKRFKDNDKDKTGDGGLTGTAADIHEAVRDYLDLMKEHRRDQAQKDQMARAKRKREEKLEKDVLQDSLTNAGVSSPLHESEDESESIASSKSSGAESGAAGRKRRRRDSSDPLSTVLLILQQEAAQDRELEKVSLA